MSERFTLAGGFEFFVRATRTRFPFRYGIAAMTEVPHQFLRITLRHGERESTGLAAEGLPPKWFTKNPQTTFAEDLTNMDQVIRHAAQLAEAIGATPHTFFEFSRALAQEQSRWAAAAGHPPLLAGLGISLCERAVLDALCRSLNRPLNQVLHEDALGLRLSECEPELRGANPAALLPGEPEPACFVRHTVGPGDPLSPD